MSRPAEADGRRLRREQNVDAVVDAVLDLLAEGTIWPTAVDIAERSAVSLRSVFRYFQDLDALTAAAVERQIRRADHLFQPLAAEGSFTERVDRLVAHRLAVHHEVGHVLRAARARAASQPAVAAGLAHRRRQLRSQIEQLFAPELTAAGDAGDETLTAVEVATGFEALEALRSDRRLSAARTGRVLARSVTALLRPRH